MNNPLISIIIPTFNSEATVAETLDSIIAQSYKKIEVIIYDGLSADDTCNIVSKYIEKHNFISLYSEKDQGVYDAMNKGIAKSKGDYLYFLGSDDVIYNSNTLQNIFGSNKYNQDLIYGDVWFKGRKKRYSGPSSIERLKTQCSICHQALFYSRRTFDIVGLYNLKYFVHADYEFNIRCFENTEISSVYVDTIIAVFNEMGLSGTQSNADGFHTDLTAKNEQEIKDKYDVISLFQENQKLKHTLNYYKNSKDYKIGRLIVGPFRVLKRMLKK